MINLKNFLIYILKIQVKHGKIAKKKRIALFVVYAQKEHLSKIHLVKFVKNAQKGNIVMMLIKINAKNVLKDIIQIY